MITTSHTPGRTMIYNNEAYLFFSGYSYYGMQTTALKKLVKEGIDKYGMLFPSARLTNTRFTLYDELEQSLSDYIGMKYSVTYHTGFTAIRSIVNYLKNNPSYRCFVAPNTHASGNIFKSTYHTTSFNEWAIQVVASIQKDSSNKTPTIIMDSYFILDAMMRDFTWLSHIKKPTLILIDDSHGIGILGVQGKGIISYLPKNNYIDYIIGYSLSKAFQLTGGVLSFNNNKWNAILQSTPEFCTTTSITPAIAHAYIHGKNIFEEQRKKLVQNIQTCYQHIQTYKDIQVNSHIPICILPKKLDEDCFLQHKIIISSFAYPYPNSKKVNRLVINALHTEKDIKKLCKIISIYCH